MRSDDEIDQVVKLIKHNKFFQGKNLKEKDMIELVSAFKFEVVAENKDVFLYGDTGEKFYIILKGLCGVRIPNPKIGGGNPGAWKAQNREYKELSEWFETIESRYEKAMFKREQKLRNSYALSQGTGTEEFSIEGEHMTPTQHEGTTTPMDRNQSSKE